MLAHAQGQGLQPLDEQEGVERAHGRAEIAQERDPRLDDVGDGSERLHRLGPDRAVIAGVGRVQHREAVGMLFPVEIAAIDDHAADGGAMAADIFRGRVDDDRGAMLERLAKTGAAVLSMISGTPSSRPIFGDFGDGKHC